MNVTHFRHFIAVVEHGGIGKAAENLYMAQPSVSQSIRSLESEYGTPLFTRSGRQLELTTAGSELIGLARRILESVDGLPAVAQQVRDFERGTLKIGVAAELAVDPLMKIVQDFRSDHDQIRLDIREATDAWATDELLRVAECELVLSFPSPSSSAAYTFLGRQELRLVLPSQMVGSMRGTSLADFSQVPLVASPRGTVLRDLIDLKFAEVGATPSIRIEVPTHHSTAELVLWGGVGAFLPPSLACEVAVSGALLPPYAPTLTVEFGFYTRSEQLSPLTQVFIWEAQQTMLEHARTQPDWVNVGLSH